ncbi:DUF4429 domain-containing protein [Nocardia beijingensis]|uniref:DUF4429 domain-containing protein n=1 Tax=Nocardia beijingensis TaxID=95162 RepID=UPI0033E9D2FB
MPVYKLNLRLRCHRALRAQSRRPLRRPECRRYPVPITAEGYNGTVTFDGWWIDIGRSGTLARLAATVNSYESKRIPLDRVEHVEWMQPSTLVDGFLRFVVTASPASSGEAGRPSTYFRSLGDELSQTGRPGSGPIRAAVPQARIVR